jgi:hypothetical protein
MAVTIDADHRAPVPFNHREPDRLLLRFPSVVRALLAFVQGWAHRGRGGAATSPCTTGITLRTLPALCCGPVACRPKFQILRDQSVLLLRIPIVTDDVAPYGPYQTWYCEVGDPHSGKPPLFVLNSPALCRHNPKRALAYLRGLQPYAACGGDRRRPKGRRRFPGGRGRARDGPNGQSPRHNGLAKEMR